MCDLLLEIILRENRKQKKRKHVVTLSKQGMMSCQILSETS